MSDFLRQNEFTKPQRVPDASAVEHLSAVKRQYARAREFCGFSLDEIINQRAAKQQLKEIWLLGCMVRKPWKAQQLPPGNVFKKPGTLLMRASR